MGRLQRRLQMLAVGIVALVIYYGFLFDIVITAKQSILTMLAERGIFDVEIPMKVYTGGGEWTEEYKYVDLLDLVDLILTLILLLGPVVIITRWFL